MAKDESVSVSQDVSYVELVAMIDTLAAKLTEMGTSQENLAAKLTEQGVAQENMASKTIVSEEKGYDIGTSEAYQMNMKRMVDEYMDASLESSRRSRTFADQIIQGGVDFAKFMNSSIITDRKSVV